jgi:hypothetical protein
MYIADWGFVKELRRHDDKLGVSWNSVKKRWNITRKVPAPSNLYDVDAHIYTVQNDDGTYRPLDARTLRLLKQSDHHQRGANTVINEMMREQEMAEEASEKFIREEEEYHVKHELLPAAKKDAEDFGAINVPKEDAAAIPSGHVTGG